MINKDKILEIITKNGKVTTKELVNDFNVSRQYLNQLIKVLLEDKQIIKIGSTRAAFYVSKEYTLEHPELLPTTFRKKYRNVNLEEHVILNEINDKFLHIENISENIRSVFTFAFSEICNNAIEHSNTKFINVEVSIRDSKLSFIVEDSGIGVFRNIKQKKKLNSEIEAIQDLLKGKTTTMPKSHSGEGIFFTSKSADQFVLNSFGLILEVTHRGPNIKSNSTIKRGTRVSFEIALHSTVHLGDIFKKYTNLVEESNYGFDKTEIRVKLFTIGGVHISRSQARRILSGLDKFKIIMLDFQDVPIVGQAFADEIYRVFQNSHPDIQIKEENMSEGVRFMVERSKNEAKKNIS